MNLETLRQTVTARFIIEWVDRTEIALPLKPFNADREDLDQWVRLSIMPGDSVNASVGSPGGNLRRGAGVVMLNIFVRASEYGLRELSEHADAAGPIFRNWQSGGLLFRAEGVRGPREDAPWFMATVSWPFQNDNFDA